MKAPALKIDWRAILNGLIGGEKIELEGGIETESDGYAFLTYENLGYFALRWDTCAVAQVKNHEKLACINEEIDEHCPADRFLQEAGIAFCGAIERAHWENALSWIDQIEERAKILVDKSAAIN